MLNAIRNSLSYVASSDNEEVEEDKEDHELSTKLGKQSEYDEARRLMSTISKTVWHSIKSFR